ncbi:DUF202 domain-containing protein [Aspergillus stella-maris]|uniref:DUF202 domain-containing protein n=1 Tax=Aspergillus stella-maris TaxID=1810926 RepID=UPI003CCE1EBC
MAESHPPSLPGPGVTVNQNPVGCVPDRSRPNSQPSQDQNHSTANTINSPSRRTSCDRDDDTLELHQIETQHDDESTGSISSGEYRITTRRTVSHTSASQIQRVQSQPQREGFIGRITRFWTRHVVLTVSQRKNRDYFALERTFLAYIRTSVILAMQGVLIAQLFRLQGAHASHGLGYHEVGVPLSVTCHCAAIVTAVLGAHRFWKQQSAIALGTVYAGGWELNVIAILVTAVG